jgi:nitrogen fixation protein FixH
MHHMTRSTAQRISVTGKGMIAYLFCFCFGVIAGAVLVMIVTCRALEREDDYASDDDF